MDAEAATPAQPAPGSAAAIAAGCCCPVGDNARGRGWLGQPGVYVMRVDCPLHGVPPPHQPDLHHAARLSP